MASISLTPVVGASALYQPPQPDSAFYVFLLWSQTDPPQSIDVKDTWAELTPPRYVGWYVFLRADAIDAKLETALRKQLMAPQNTSFAWITYTGGNVTTHAL